MLASGRPTIYLYDDLPGGAGLSTRAHALGRSFFERVLAVVRGCSCASGCPTCIGTQVALDPVGPPPVDDPQHDPQMVARRHARADLLATIEALMEGL